VIESGGVRAFVTLIRGETPQCGHAAALVERTPPHSGQAIKAIRSSAAMWTSNRAYSLRQLVEKVPSVIAGEVIGWDRKIDILSALGSDLGCGDPDQISAVQTE
jgi:hypothetical protein